MPGMRRRFFPGVLIALVLGAATTVVVSWAFSRRTLVGGRQSWWAHRERTGAEGAGYLLVTESRRFGTRSTMAQAANPGWGDGGTYAMVKQSPTPGIAERYPSRDLRPIAVPWVYSGRPWPGADTAYTVSVHSYGWPLPALAAVQEYGGWTGETWKHVLRFGPPRASLSDPRGFPTRILPIGFAVNTLAAVALWHLALFMPPLIRRGVRRRRGRCIACGYDLRGTVTDPCPECGAGPEATVTGAAG